MPLPLIALGVVFVLIAIRQVGRMRFQIWQIMLGGAVTVLLTGFISPSDALRAACETDHRLPGIRESREPLTAIQTVVYWAFLRGAQLILS